MNYKKNCPTCGKEILYKNKKSYARSIAKNLSCISCVKKKDKISKLFYRLCPSCNKQIEYKAKSSFIRANKNNCVCLYCASAKGHTEEAKIKRQLANIGENNAMFGKSFYEIWLNKYGKEVADKNLEEFKKKRRNNTCGKNNPMYGKQTPKGSGNGWSGHYKGFYFRSLLELSYLKYLLDNNIKFENGEKSKYCIEYTFFNKERTYRPDYYLFDTEEIVEIKPSKLTNSKENKVKFEVANNRYGNKFKILTEKDIVKISLDEIYNMYINNDLIWDKRYEEKFLIYYQTRKE